MFKKFLLEPNADLALLFLRVAVAAFLFFGHGLGKFMHFAENSPKFSDPLGIGPDFSYLLATSAEFLCAILVALGLFTRFALIPLCINMLVAAFVVHADDPWKSKEFALLYFIPFFTVLISGPGTFSLDNLLFSPKSDLHADK